MKRRSHWRQIRWRCHPVLLVLGIVWWLAGVGWEALAVFTAILWHEAGHTAVALLHDVPLTEVQLLPFGGVAQMNDLSERHPLTEGCIAAAGPAASLAGAALTAGASAQGWLPGELGALLYKTHWLLALGNLLPALPLDGGRLLRAYLALRGTYRHATRSLLRCGYGVAAVLLGVVGGQCLWQHSFNLTVLTTAVLIVWYNRQEMARLGLRGMRILLQKKAQLAEGGSMPAVWLTALAHTPVRDLLPQFGPERYYVIAVLNTQHVITGYVTETVLWEALPERGLAAPIGAFLPPPSPDGRG